MLLGAAIRDDDAVGVRPQPRRSLAVIAERAVAALHRGPHTLGLGGADEVERVGGRPGRKRRNPAQNRAQ
jgi:hypothetical protein